MGNCLSLDEYTPIPGPKKYRYGTIEVTYNNCIGGNDVHIKGFDTIDEQLKTKREDKYGSGYRSMDQVITAFQTDPNFGGWILKSTTQASAGAKSVIVYTFEQLIQ